MMGRTLLAVVMALFGTSVANGLTVRVASPEHSAVPEFYYAPSDNAPLELTLELANEAMFDSPPVISWQLAMRISGSQGASGGIAFETASLPEDAIFGSDSIAFLATELPADHLVGSDADTSVEFSGVVIPPQASAPVVAIGLLPTTGAAGDFVLSMTAFDANDIDHCSFWTHPPEYEFVAFDNPIAAANEAPLAIVHVVESNVLAGDFNHDDFVDAADYTVWRDGLNAGFTATDYLLWKDHYGEASTIGAIAVPEPFVSAVGLLCSPAILALRSSYRRSIFRAC